MTSTELISQRLHNQKLSSSEFKKPADVVRWLGAVQAQDFNAAKWALALRMRGATNVLIEKAFNEGKILRTHVMRPTWHFVTPDDIRWLLQLTAPGVKSKSGAYFRKNGLDAATLKRSNRALTKALRGGQYLTRRALRTILNQSGVAADDSIRLGHILLGAELDRVIVSGPLVGNQFTYALFDERVPATKALDRNEALAKLTRRYFTSHGPATLQDFIWWSGLSTADARHGIALVERHLEEKLIDEKLYRSPRSEIQNSPQSKISAHLLPAYDEYFVAYKDRQAVLHPNDANPLTSMQGLLGPTVIVDGRVAGTWRPSNDKTIAFNSSRVLSRSEQVAVARAAEQYAAFLDPPIRNLRPGRT